MKLALKFFFQLLFKDQNDKINQNIDCDTEHYALSFNLWTHFINCELVQFFSYTLRESFFITNFVKVFPSWLLKWSSFRNKAHRLSFGSQKTGQFDMLLEYHRIIQSSWHLLKNVLRIQGFNTLKTRWTSWVRKKIVCIYMLWRKRHISQSDLFLWLSKLNTPSRIRTSHLYS